MEKLHQIAKVSKGNLIICLLIALNSPLAFGSIVTYEVLGGFFEPSAKYPTIFEGSFDWDGSIVSNFHGTMNSSMWDVDNDDPNYKNSLPFSFPLIQLNHQLAQSVNGNIVTASVFKENSTDVFQNGGYATGDYLYYGYEDGNIRNWNAYFTLAFDKTTMQGVLDNIVYGDCTLGGMMGPVCMTGHKDIGTMGAVPGTIEITPTSAVPLPGAVWLFASAMVGLISVRRSN